MFGPHKLPLLTVYITPEILKAKIISLKQGAAGPDKISPRVLTDLFKERFILIALIFYGSLSDKVVPTDGKLSNVTSI